MKISPLITNENAARYTFFFIIAALLFRAILANYTGFGIGESYYFGGARVLELSYVDQPPLFMWLSGLLMRVLGETTLVLRLPALLFLSGTSWILFLMTRRFFNAAAGFYAVFFLNLSGVFFLSGVWFQPDAPLLFFWMAYAYCLTQIIFIDKSERGRSSQKTFYAWWILSGLMLGFTILSKYHAIFLVMGLFLFLITAPRSRHWLFHPGIYLSLLISLLIASPIFIWNAQHHWISFLFQGDRALNHGVFHLHLDWFFRSFLGQALWILPWIWVPLVLQLFKAYVLRNKDPYYGFCFWMALTPVVFFTVVTLWADLQYHFHWQAPGYMMLYILLGKMVSDRITQNERWHRRIRRWLIFTLVFTVGVFSILALHMQTGFWTAYGPKVLSTRLEHRQIPYDPTMDGYDFTDLMTAFEKRGWLHDPNIAVGTTSWIMTGKIDWALKGKKEIVSFDQDSRNYMYFFDPDKVVGKNLIIVTWDRGDFATTSIAPFCEKFTRLPDVEITRHGVNELNLWIYECHHFHLGKNVRHDLPVYQALTHQLP